ncbi:MAG: DUF4143 domain-containing protein, partial [Oligoflexia bacterium]|nr:DUF4143 domain-containing protein [Oligoflexia bacterium]
GLPEPVALWVEKKNIFSCFEIQKSLAETYRQDFEKYAKKHFIKYLDTVLSAVPAMTGKKFVYSNVSQEYKSRELSRALDLLNKAGIVHLVNHSGCNGVPLGAEENRKIFKAVFFDVALAQTLLNLDKREWLLNGDEYYVNKGPLAESFVGQELLCYMDPEIKPRLYYWAREARGSMSELDYVVSKGSKVLPIEVKSGPNGKLKSLNIFLSEKKHVEYGFKISKANYSKKGNIISLPVYAVKNIFT